MKNPTPAGMLFSIRARTMEEEARGAVLSPLGRDGGPPVMTHEELLDQARRFKAVLWVKARDGTYHKVGIARSGRLAFSHHTMKELRRELAFAEFGGEVCPCVEYLDVLADDAAVWLPSPHHFRTEVLAAMTVRARRRHAASARLTSVKPKPTRHMFAAFRSRSRTRVDGRRVRYEQED